MSWGPKGTRRETGCPPRGRGKEEDVEVYQKTTCIHVTKIECIEYPEIGLGDWVQTFKSVIIFGGGGKGILNLPLWGVNGEGLLLSSF